MTLGSGKMALRLAIERWIDLRSEGWYSGDTRAHFLSPHAALLEAAAEDVAFVNLLALEFAAAMAGTPSTTSWPSAARSRPCKRPAIRSSSTR